MRDLSVRDLDDRAEPIVVFHACRNGGPMDLVFDDDHTTGICLMDNQLVGRLKRNGIAAA
jgi:hypothetical protein